MRRDVDGVVYDTTLAIVIASHQSNTTHVHRSTSLFCSSEGRYFLVEEKEAHGVESVQFMPLSDSMAQAWLENHGRSDVASALSKDGRIYLRVELDTALFSDIDAAAKAAGLSYQAWITNVLKTTLADAPSAASYANKGQSAP